MNVFQKCTVLQIKRVILFGDEKLLNHDIYIPEFRNCIEFEVANERLQVFIMGYFAYNKYFVEYCIYFQEEETLQCGI